MNLNSEGLDIVGSIRPSCEITEVELDLVPAFVKSHWHRTDKGLHSSCTLIVGCSEPPSHVLVIKDLNLECEILFQLWGDLNRLTFLMIITRKGNLIPRVLLLSLGQVI